MMFINRYRFERWELDRGIWRRSWFEETHNLVVTQGLNEIQKEFWTGAAYTAALFVGLIRTDNFGSIVLGDTAAKIVTGVPAGGDNQWREFTGYSQATRPVLTMGAVTAGSLDNSAMQAIFDVTSNFTLQGGLVATSSVKGGTGGLLIGAASFASQIPFAIGQQVRVTISSTLSNG